MIQVTANARKACAVTDDLITTGSIGIPVSFSLSADFNGLSNIAVFRGSGATVDVILTDNSCVVPPETLATANSELWVGVYGRNADGTIAIPTVWAGAFNIHYGAVPSGVDPSERTPDWTAQVQAAATEALQVARSVEARADAGDFDGETGPEGAPGFSPVATVTQTSTGATISITDAEGTTTAEISNGQDGATGPAGADGVGVPAGGTTGQVLSKASGTDYDTEWTTPEAGGVQDVQVNGVSVLQDGVANVPIGGTSPNTGDLGVCRSGNGVRINSSGNLYINSAGINECKAGSSSVYPIAPSVAYAASFYGLAKAAGFDEKNSTLPVGQYTESAKSAISQMLNGSVSVTGSTPSITALPGIRYVCGEVATLDITLPASGIVDVVFTSGSTPTVLTVTPPTGMTVEWANGFDSTALEADTMYELNIMSVGTKCLGVCGVWS